MSGTQSTRFLLMAGGLVALALFSGCGPRPAGGVAADADPGGGTGAPGEAAPAFRAMDLDGQPFELAETSGKVRLIDFWATWCAPCREEIPMLVELNEQYGERGFEVVAISDENAAVLREFVRREGIPYTNLIDAYEHDGETVTGRVAEEFVVLGLPTGFLIDREGKIVERFNGPKPAKILERQIRELLELPPA